MDRDNLERELWIRTYVAVAGASNTYGKERVATWADQAVDDYRKRYPPEKP